MGRVRLILVLLITATLFSCMVSKTKYQTMEAKQVDTQIALDQGAQDLAKKHNKLLKTEMALYECQEVASGRAKQVQALEKEKAMMAQQVTDLEQANMKMASSMDQVQGKLQESQAVIDVQKQMIERMNATKNQIRASLKTEIESGQIFIEQVGDKLKVTFVDKILFNSGSAVINRKGKSLLLKVAPILADRTQREIQIQGHTDDQKLSSGLQKKYPTNWELSTARACSVVRYLSDQGKIPPERLVAAGLSYFHPVGDNKTPEGRSQNRRIEIILVPKQ